MWDPIEHAEQHHPVLSSTGNPRLLVRLLLECISIPRNPHKRSRSSVMQLLAARQIVAQPSPLGRLPLCLGLFNQLCCADVVCTVPAGL